MGFIRKLPTELVDAFKATLEELTYADLLLHVIDISNPEYEAQAAVVDDLIERLGASQTPCLRVYNKCDAFAGRLPNKEDDVCICARTGEGTEALLHAIEKRLEGGLSRVRLLIPFTRGNLLQTLQAQANVLELTYREEGAEVLAVGGSELLHLVAPYQIHE